MTEVIWTTRTCADFLGVTPQFVRNEIRDGRLKADVFERRTPLGVTRCLYRIPLSKFQSYCAEYWPEAAKRLPAVAA
ncbi:MAG: hypothetical protein Q8T13_23740 [Acidobacteriota bacterium]|nr:hypothetical protein [Acidobacteriota bacterium]